MPIQPETPPPSLSADTEAALRDIAASLGLRLLVVFGSLAAGRGTSESDLDIGVLAEGRGAVEAVERRVLEEALHPRPDVVDLNRLVHEYDGLDDRKVHEALAAALADLTEFVVQVERFVEGSSPR